MMEQADGQAAGASSIYICSRMELVREAACRVHIHARTAHYVMLIVSEGTGYLALAGGGADLQRGGCVLLGPGTSTRLEVGEEGAIFYQIEFAAVSYRGTETDAPAMTSPAAFDEWLRQSVMVCGAFSACLTQVETLYRHRMERDELERMEQQLRFQSLLLFLLRQFRQAGGLCGMRHDVQRSVEYVLEHYDEPLTVEALAAMSATSRWKYTQTFKEMTGQLPVDFLNTVRIEKAQQLLMLTDDKLHQIARTVGFNSEYYFNRKFKQMVGVTPGQYRGCKQNQLRLFAPFLEDYLLALGVVPIVQYSHKHWGRQEYLNLPEVPAFDITSGDWAALARYKPEFILLDDGYKRWNLEQCARISPVFKLPYCAEDWQVTLQAVGAILGRTDRAAAAIRRYRDNCAEAKARLSRTVRNETVAVLRLSSKSVILYGGSERGYTGPLLYGDLGLAQPDVVRTLARNERRVSLTPEELARLDADHLFVTFDNEEGQQTGRELLQSPLWNSLPAVKGHRVYEVDFLAWMNFGVLSHNRKIDDVLRVLG
ncbi:HTH-type transcriptional activator Btr [Paenibacillus solanacearum]|uniref:HTH-type transcriptional activator Btr n=1 Tax=Paenibacillus solanacearum TaxID=2048548 RepID=A0A916NGU7_9BACL|nr:AraC family transcriptional regulator [Paenibacillus solanacearum]CAG7610376.1 HTH-type transcriptional activator Btr [Paenibacillus solanacearum]